MARKKRRQAPEAEGEITGINVTPLVDVCLVLVIIFMVTAPIMSNPAFKVDLPVARTQEGEEKDKTTLSLSADGRMSVDDKEFKKLDELAEELKMKMSMSESKLVILRADANAEHGALTDLMSRAKEAGALSMTIATSQPKKGNPAAAVGSSK
ncbi:MAG: biopolymer transporter ExbD [Elusimicrobia bacterium]|nr:biopolymer transporter ExbD [Elusimicrobiota bacterium]